LSDDECTSLFPDPHFGLYKVRKSKPEKKKAKISADDASKPLVHFNARLATCRSRLLMKNINSKPKMSVIQHPLEKEKLNEIVGTCDGSPQNAGSPASQKSSKRKSSISGNSPAVSVVFGSVRKEGCIDSQFDDNSPTNQGQREKYEDALLAINRLSDQYGRQIFSHLAGRFASPSDQQPCSSENR
jgi:hypothetical protein